MTDRAEPGTLPVMRNFINSIGGVLSGLVLFVWFIGSRFAAVYLFLLGLFLLVEKLGGLAAIIVLVVIAVAVEKLLRRREPGYKHDMLAARPGGRA